MGDELVWQDRYNTGIDFIDTEHQKLFGIVNRLIGFTETPGAKSQWACQEGTKYLKRYTETHFQEEEDYMQSIGYEGYEVHKQLHDNFRYKTLPGLEKDLAESEYSYESIRHFLGVCVGWLTGHTLSEDLAIVGKGKANVGELLPQEEAATLQQVIIRLVHELFAVDTTIVSDHYAGEDFGSALCYRVVFGSEQKEDKYEVIMTFEEALLLATAKKSLGIAYTELNDVVINATRYVAQQFIKEIKGFFPEVESCDIETESLFHYHELRKVFAKDKPRHSLHFDTDDGQFSFSFLVNAVHEDIGYPIAAENAMEQIQNFLHKRPKAGMRKILIVDDSSMIRAAMKKLLEKDYGIEVADSSMAAIKSIVLDKPDLILLDYEMPICNGKQMFTMIRTDEELGKIPVIFLTGRGDKDSVMQVLDLNPAGYMLKTMHSSNIKKNIDYFFEKNQKAV